MNLAFYNFCIADVVSFMVLLFMVPNCRISNVFEVLLVHKSDAIYVICTFFLIHNTKLLISVELYLLNVLRLVLFF